MLVWTLADRRSHWCSQLGDVEPLLDKLCGDIYLGVGAAEQNHGSTQRAKAEQVGWLPGLWLDLDYRGAAHKSENLPPDQESCLELLRQCELDPTIIVHSGYGIQAYWCFEAPWRLDSAAARRSASELSQSWQSHLQAMAAAKGWKVDATHDLARVMRLPGTQNHKGDSPVPCRVLTHTGPRHTAAAFREAISEAEPQDGLFGAVNGAAKPVNGRKPKTWDDYEKIFTGVSEGERNNSLASLAGKLVQNLRDLDDTGSVRVAMHSIIAVNRGFRPPLPEDEVRRTFKSILRSEQQRRIGGEAAELLKPTIEEQVATPASKDEVGDWRLIIVDADPPEFQLFAPQFKTAEGGYLTLTAEQMCSAAAIRIQALRQASFPLPKWFIKIWDSKREVDGEEVPPLYESLVRSAEKVSSQDEDRRRWVVADRLLQQIETAVNWSRDKPIDRNRINRDTDSGAVLFQVTPVWEAMALTADKVQRRELLKLLEILNTTDFRAGENGNLRFKKIDRRGLDKLRQIVLGKGEP